MAGIRMAAAFAKFEIRKRKNTFLFDDLLPTLART